MPPCAGDDLHGVGDLARRIATWRGDDDDFGVQALRHLGVEPGAVRLFLGVHQALDDHDAGLVRGLFVTGDDLFQQHVFLIVSEQFFCFRYRNRRRWIQAGHHPPVDSGWSPSWPNESSVPGRYRWRAAG